jgi:hypothetical protein
MFSSCGDILGACIVIVGKCGNIFTLDLLIIRELQGKSIKKQNLIFNFRFRKICAIGVTITRVQASSFKIVEVTMGTFDFQE